MNTCDKIKYIKDNTMSLTIEINDHKEFCKTAQEELNEIELMSGLDVKQDVLDKMRATDTIIRLMCYPDTPVSFYDVLHYDFDLAVDQMYNIIKEIRE